MLKEVGGDPSDEKVKEFVVNTLNSGVSFLHNVSIYLNTMIILVPRGCNPFDQHQKTETSGQSQFFEHAQSTCLIFSANQICQI